MTARDYCFTSFKMDAIDSFMSNEEEKKKVKYFVAQQEISPETNRPHIQGFVRYNKPVRFSAVRATLGDVGVHVEKRKGTPAEVKHFHAENMLSLAEPMLCCAEVFPPKFKFCYKCVHFLCPYSTG